MSTVDLMGFLLDEAIKRSVGDFGNPPLAANQFRAALLEQIRQLSYDAPNKAPGAQLLLYSNNYNNYRGQN